MTVASSESFADSSRAGIVERHALCAQSPVHLAESAAPSGTSRLRTAVFNKLRKQKLINICMTITKRQNGHHYTALSVDEHCIVVPRAAITHLTLHTLEKPEQEFCLYCCIGKYHNHTINPLSLSLLHPQYCVAHLKIE